MVHNQRSGVAHFIEPDEETCLRDVCRLLSFLPSNNMDDPPLVDLGDDPARVDLALDDIRLTEGVTNFELIENSPFRIDGRPCYRLLYSHRIDSGLKVKTVEFGCWTRRGLYRIEYRAAAQHYFDQYLDVFERFRQGIRFAS